ncbi:MAG: hypothetical protein M0Z54_08870 [Thermaerobacter sp.]|nr:hypothetical protein [Thermaerobacter sp.]
MAPDTVGVFHQVVAEIGVAGPGQRAGLAGQRPGLGRRPGEARELGQLVVAWEALEAADFRSVLATMDAPDPVGGLGLGPYGSAAADGSLAINPETPPFRPRARTRVLPP